MDEWQARKGRRRLGEVVRREVRQGPVARHGEEVAVVVDVAEYRRLRGDAPGFGRFLLADPDWGDDIEFPRNQDLPREIDLG